MSNRTAKNPIVVPPSQAWDGNDGPWSTFSIHVGTPAQPTRVLVSTVVGEAWVISDNKTEQGGCLSTDSAQCPKSRGGLINVNQSSTWQDQGIFALGAEINLPDYTTGYDNGDYGLESLGIGLPGSDGITLSNQVVAALATKDFYMGSLGVTSRPTNFTGFNDPHTSFLSSLKEQDHIPSLTFGYTAGNQYRLKKIFGSLTLGGYDQSKFIPNDVSFQFATDISRDLVVGLQSITYSDSKTTNKPLLSQGILTFVDATVPHIWLPKESCTAFEKAFGLQYNSTINRYLVNNTLHDELQQQNASVSFIVGNDISGGATVNITLPYAAFDLTVGPPIVNTSQKYFPLRRADNETQYTLGRTFLQESYLVVDYERSNFTLSQCLFQANTPQQLVAIPSANLTAPGMTKTAQNGLSVGAIAGIVVAAVVILALAGGTALFCILRRRARKRQEEERRKEEEEIAQDPLAQKAEMEGSTKAPLGELHAPGKPGFDPNSHEMEGSKGEFHIQAKLRAEMEGDRGGVEMDGSKERHEMHAGPHRAPVEMWAGSYGLFDEDSSTQVENSSRPSPQSHNMPSSSDNGGPSPASPASNTRSNRFTWGRGSRSSVFRHGEESSGVSSPSEGPASPSLQQPQRAVKPQDVPSLRQERAQRITRRLQSASKADSNSYLSVPSPRTESVTGPKPPPKETGADRWNQRFGSRPREHLVSQVYADSPHQSISSPSSDSRSRERRKHSISRHSPQPEVSSPSSDSSGRLLRHQQHFDSWTSRVSTGGGSPSVSSPSSEDRRSQTMPGGFF